MRIKRKSNGFMMVSAALTAIVFILLASSFVGLCSGMFSTLKSGRTASVAQQYAEIDANTLTLLQYDELDSAVHGRANIAGADGWQSEVTIGLEKIVGDGNRQRIGTVKIYKNGEGIARASQQVPLYSQGNSNSGVPIGTVLWYAAMTPPKGFIECNGQSTAAYPKLAAVVGFSVPDLRGSFIRGWDHGRGVDVGRNFLDMQDASSAGSLYQVQQTWEKDVPSLCTVPENGTWSGAVLTSTTNTNGSLKFRSRNVIGGTRPMNVSLLPCIKAI